jgi:hypothetical protein
MVGILRRAAMGSGGVMPSLRHPRCAEQDRSNMKAEAIITWEEHQKMQGEVAELRLTVKALRENLDKLRKDVNQLTNADDGR